MGHTNELRREWRPVPDTANWALVDLDSEMVLRHVAVRGPYLGSEPEGTKYEVTGDGHEHSKHESLDQAKAAAETSLD